MCVCILCDATLRYVIKVYKKSRVIQVNSFDIKYVYII